MGIALSRSGKALGTSMQVDSLCPRPDYIAEMDPFEHVLKSSLPRFNKITEDGLRFRIYRIGSLEVRTTQEYDGKELIGAVFSITSKKLALMKGIHGDEKVVKVTEYVEKGSQILTSMLQSPCCRYYVVLETEGGNAI